MIILQGKTKPNQENWGTINRFTDDNRKYKPETVRARAERQMEMWQRTHPNWQLRILEIPSKHEKVETNDAVQ